MRPKSECGARKSKNDKAIASDSIDMFDSSVKLRIFDQSNRALIVLVYHYRLRIFDVTC